MTANTLTGDSASFKPWNVDSLSGHLDQLHVGPSGAQNNHSGSTVNPNLSLMRYGTYNYIHMYYRFKVAVHILENNLRTYVIIFIFLLLFLWTTNSSKLKANQKYDTYSTCTIPHLKQTHTVPHHEQSKLAWEQHCDPACTPTAAVSRCTDTVHIL